jgi:hypothetical protein
MSIHRSVILAPIAAIRRSRSTSRNQNWFIELVWLTERPTLGLVGDMRPAPGITAIRATQVIRSRIDAVAKIRGDDTGIDARLMFNNQEVFAIIEPVVDELQRKLTTAYAGLLSPVSVSEQRQAGQRWRGFRPSYVSPAPGLHHQRRFGSFPRRGKTSGRLSSSGRMRRLS